MSIRYAFNSDPKPQTRKIIVDESAATASPGRRNLTISNLENTGVCNPPDPSNFRVEDCTIPKIEDGEVLVETVYLSMDPAQRCQMNEETGVDYIEPLRLGETVHGLGGMGKIIQSKCETLNVGDIVVNSELGWPWQRICVRKASELTKGNLRKGETCVISSAAGAVGMLAGQICKLLEAGRVIGITSTPEKCEYLLTSNLGFDSAIAYKTEDVSTKLKEMAPEGVDLYFDNVGGDISDTVIKQMNEGGDVILCGAISTYNTDVGYPPPISEELQQIIRQKSINRNRFLVLDYTTEFPEALRTLEAWFRDGKLKCEVTMRYGLENAGSAFVEMMEGKNIGKMLVEVTSPRKG
ncbi:unnamed protein product [Cyprideis torosa]|uniref:15-oxoprostaglandin 13-reductase n=1 Tax=Cyprideis torosa TaxID=163714 RepID=A0A7R8W8G1_9CRUS|nr:unnamed protein product [Cyprideis torosa]CAG0888569.1 unnamed protein product [Cyprideis torosa]